MTNLQVMIKNLRIRHAAELKSLSDTVTTLQNRNKELMNKFVRTKGYEQNPDHEDKSIKIEVDGKGGQLWIDIKADNHTFSQGVLLEVWEGELRAIVWADPEEEDPTHKIKIEPMSAEFRKEYDEAIGTYSQQMQDDL